MFQLQGLAPVDSTDSVNPFVVLPQTPLRKKPWVRLTVLVIVCSASVLAVHSYSQRWLLSRLAYQLESHPPRVQAERLAMLAEFGVSGLPDLIAAVASDNEDLAGTAFKVVTQMQSRWQTSAGSDPAEYNEAMVEAIDQALQKCQPEQRYRLARLLDQLVLDTVESVDARDSLTFQRASSLLSSIGGPPNSRLGDEESPRIATSNPLTPIGNNDVSGLSGAGLLPPLPLGETESVSDTRQRNSRGEYDSQNDSANTTGASYITTDDGANGSLEDDRQMPVIPELAQTQHRTSTLSVPKESETITANPLSPYDTRSVIGFISSIQPSVRSAAEAELRARGFQQNQLELAERLNSGDRSVRLALVEELATRSDIDPRQWYLWLAVDSERDVRLQAIARLGTMDDPQIIASLGDLLKEERDPTVATRLRRLLGLR